MIIINGYESENGISLVSQKVICSEFFNGFRREMTSVSGETHPLLLPCDEKPLVSMEDPNRNIIALAFHFPQNFESSLCKCVRFRVGYEIKDEEVD